MGNRVRKYRFIDIHRIGENESWLTDMSAKGLHLRKLGPAYAHFERGEPKRMRYRIDFTYKTPEADGEQRALYAGSGWDYVCEQHDMRIYCSPEGSDAPELHTDPAEQAYTLQRLKRRLTALAIWTALLYAAGLCMMGFAVFMGKTPTLTIIEGSMLNMPFIILLYIYGTVFTISTAVSIRNLIRSLREGRAINHRADWRRLYRSRMIAMLILVIMTPFVTLLPIASIVMRNTEELPHINSNQMHIRLAEIENDPLLERKATAKIHDIDWLNSVTREWSPYAPIMLEIREQGVIPGRMWPDGSGEYSPSIDCNIYRLRFTWMADALLRDLCRKFEDYGQEPIREETERQGFDRLYVREEQFWLEIFASKRSTVVRLRYYGEKDLQSVIDAAARLLGTA